MSRTLSRLTLTAALLTPLVTLVWSDPRRHGATVRSRATIGTLSTVTLQQVDSEGDSADPCGGLSAWSRTRTAAHDPFPIRLWGATRFTDGAAWAQMRRMVHHRLLMQAQSRILLTDNPLDAVLSGLHLTDVEAAQRVVALVSGRQTQAETLGALLADLHAATRL